MMRFPVTDFLSEEECYQYLLDALHPEGLRCPNGHELPDGQAPHDRSRAPIVKYRCRECGAVYNLFTGTTWSGTHYDCKTIVMVLRGIAQGVPTLHLAEELDLDDSTLLNRRHQIQQQAIEGRPTGLPDQAVEADEMFPAEISADAGEKADPHPDPDDLPRQRANKQRGRGTYENDRPPTLGLVGRTSGELRLIVCTDTQQTTITPKIEAYTEPVVVLYTDGSNAYGRVEKTGRSRRSVNHSEGEWARDDDGDGLREVHCNTIEGIWTGLRNFLRRFRGVHKKYLAQYVAIFEWEHNLKEVTGGFLRMLMDPDFTPDPT
jgi:transposase-like protein